MDPHLARLGDRHISDQALSQSTITKSPVPHRYNQAGDVFLPAEACHRVVELTATSNDR
jgi:hypothetical protein